MVLPKLPQIRQRRVVITGMGLLTPLGVNVEQSWVNLCAGKTGIRALTSEDHPSYPSLEVRIAGKLPAGFDYQKWLTALPQAQNKVNAYAAAVTTEALANAGWKPSTDTQKQRSGLTFATCFGSLSTLLDTQTRIHSKGYPDFDQFTMSKLLTTGHLSSLFHLYGPAVTVNTACASGQTAIGEAFHLIRRGNADVMVAGGAEDSSHPFLVAGFSKIGALNAENNGYPEGASRPFDWFRKGFVLGEGAGAVVLEELEHAQARKAKIYAEVLGFAAVMDAEYLTKSSEDGDGAYRAMQAAMKMAEIEAKEIDHIKAHGTGSEEGDVSELTAILRTFKVPGPVITANKGGIGHLLGAAGVVEAAFATLSVHNDMIPPIVNMKQPLELYAGTLKPNYARTLMKQRVSKVMCNATGFGGVNTSLVLAKCS